MLVSDSASPLFLPLDLSCSHPYWRPCRATAGSARFPQAFKPVLKEDDWEGLGGLTRALALGRGFV